MSALSAERARFIVFEGPNGVGKSAVSAAFADKLRELDVQALLTTEPTHSAYGAALRAAETQLSGRALALAVAADRVWHMENEVEPALSRGEWVVCDRYLPSSLVLQRLDGVPVDLIWQLNEPLLIPDLTIFLQAGTEVLRSRLDARPTRTRFEQQDGARERLYYEHAIDDVTQRDWPSEVISSDRTIAETVGAALEALQKLTRS
jgi:dTMP kinase